jgi:putative phosphoribosyl transferase
MRAPIPFADRQDAACRLAEALVAWRGHHPLVLAVPRGAVPMGQVVAEELGGELDVVQVRKLGAPFNPELAVGAVDESGWRSISPHARLAGADPAYIEEETRRELERMRQRRARWSPLRPPVDPAGRVVIVVDDGVATGQSMIAALHAVRSRHPQHLICAVGVAPPDTLDLLRSQADEVVCLVAPPDFQAVGEYYRDFRQVEDAEVEAILAQAAGAGRGKP